MRERSKMEGQLKISEDSNSENSILPVPPSKESQKEIVDSPPIHNESTGSLESDNQDEDKQILAKKPKLFPIFGKNYKPQVNPLKAVQIEVEKNTGKKRKRTLLAKEIDGLSQTVLDAGQKHLGPKYCEECGLLYSPGDFEDEEEHRKAHLRLENAFTISLWKEARIVFTYPDGCQIVMVQCNTDGKRVLNRLQDFLPWLDSELGAGYAPSGTNKSERILLYITRTKRKNQFRILGCGVMEIPDPERINACSLVPNEQGTKDDGQSVSVDVNSAKERSISIGITRLWTDAGFRGKKIASKIVDAMRVNSGLLGCVIPKSQMGILEPSDDGRAFMKKYTDCVGALYTYKY